jgi:hypothetical protein
VDDDDDDEDDQVGSDLIDFVEQEDGTRVEVKQKKVQLGAEVKREEGGRMYRVVSPDRMISSMLISDHT